MQDTEIDIIVIGGSSGSIGVVSAIVNALPPAFTIPVVIIIHRRKNVPSDLKGTMSGIRSIQEPEDKEPIKKGHIYLAPQNYHLLVEQEHVFSLDYSELVHFSRPSIDVSFMSAAYVYKQKTLGILLSGANRDGSEGIAAILTHGGRAIAQDPATAEYPLMPETAIKNNLSIEIHDPQKIVDVLLSIKNAHTL